MIFKNETINALLNARLVVVFTGAGVTIASGLPAYRDTSSIWAAYHANELASLITFQRNPELAWIWCRERRNGITNAEPSEAHIALVELEKLLQRVIIITQTVDGLHARAGSSEVLELYGNFFKAKCLHCNKPQPEDFISDNMEVPHCRCRERKPLRPDIVLEGEDIPNQTMLTANKIVEAADVFILTGSTGEIYPSGTLFMQAKFFKSYMIEINPVHTNMTRYTNDAVQMPPSQGLLELLEQIRLQKQVAIQ
jgi:NAD-dependent deacetylase